MLTTHRNIFIMTCFIPFSWHILSCLVWKDLVSHSSFYKLSLPLIMSCNDSWVRILRSDVFSQAYSNWLYCRHGQVVSWWIPEIMCFKSPEKDMYFCELLQINTIRVFPNNGLPWVRWAPYFIVCRFIISKQPLCVAAHGSLVLNLHANDSMKFW